jgi:hypothetical protein
MTYKKKVSTKKMRKSTKKSHTRKKRINTGGGDTVNPSFTNKLIHRVLLLIEGLILESIDQLGNTLGLDVSNPQQVNAKLDELKIIVSDPETQEKVRIIVGKMGILLSIAFEAVDPYIQPLADKINKIYVQSTSELGKSSITILKNIAKAIPVYGALVALIDSANTITVTAANTVSAKNHMQSAYDDALIAASLNFKDLLSKKKDLLSRIPSGEPDVTQAVNPQI